jgi:hypothetical protein
MGDEKSNRHRDRARIGGARGSGRNSTRQTAGSFTFPGDLHVKHSFALTDALVEPGVLPLQRLVFDGDAIQNCAIGVLRGEEERRHDQGTRTGPLSLGSHLGFAGQVQNETSRCTETQDTRVRCQSNFCDRSLQLPRSLISPGVQ